jgi:hypothetical protein
MWMTMSNKSYDFAYSRHHYKTPGRFHHVTYALDSRKDILRAADIFLENGVTIETGRTSTPSSRRSFCMCMSPAATAFQVANAGARAHLGDGLEADRVDRGGAQEGTGVGAEDDRVVSYAWHAAGGGVRLMDSVTLDRTSSLVLKKSS